MPVLSDMTDNDRHSVIIYGGPKTSKTTTVAKLAEHFTLDYFDLERGRQAILSNFRQNANGCKAEWLKNINMFSIPDSRNNPVAINTMIKVLSEERCRICHLHGMVNCAECIDFKTLTPKAGKGFDEIELKSLPKNHVVVIDSGTQLTASALNHVCKGKDLDYKQQFEDWRRQGNMLTLILMAIQVGSYHCILITHDMLIDLSKDPDTHDWKTFPQFGTRELSKTCAKYFDHAVNTDIVNNRFVLNSNALAAPGVLVGSRANVDLREQKSATELLNAIFKGQVEKENKPAEVKLAAS